MDLCGLPWTPLCGPGLGLGHASALGPRRTVAKRSEEKKKGSLAPAYAAGSNLHALSGKHTQCRSAYPQEKQEDRRRLDLVVYGATPHGGALCCDATLVSPLTRTGHPQPCTVTIDGAALRVAERRKHAAYPELARAGPQKLVVLGSEVGGRWNEGARSFVRQLVRVRAQRAPPAIRAAAAAGWRPHPRMAMVSLPCCRPSLRSIPYTQHLDDPPRAQPGPFVAKVLTALPAAPELRLEAVAFRVLLLYLLRLQLLLVLATCTCRHRLDASWRPPCILPPLWLVTAPGHPARKSSSPCLPPGGRNGQHRRHAA